VVRCTILIVNGVPMSDFEESLLALDARLGEIQKRGKAVASAIARARIAAKLGRVSEITKDLDEISRRISDASAAVDGLSDAWQFDTTAYLADGRFLNDLKAAAAERSLALFEKDGRVYCFPLLLRIDAQESAVKIGRRLERRIRPKELAGLLAAAQKRQQRFHEAQFLDLLYNGWRRVVGSGWRGIGVGPAVPLAEIHETLTLFPGTDYSADEFSRDLLLLDRRPDLRTRDGCRFELPASTLSKGRARRLVVYDEEGREHTYVGLRFLKEG
jgi:hypothetical protein